MLKKSENKNTTTPRFDLMAPQGRTLTVCIATFLFLPVIASATTFTQLIVFFVGEILNKLVIIIVGLATVYFLWGVAKYILHSDDQKSREEGRSMMIYGIIAIFVMVSIWGFVNLLDNTFRLDNNTLPRAEDFIP